MSMGKLRQDGNTIVSMGKLREGSVPVCTYGETEAG